MPNVRPHDAFFHLLFSDPELADAVIRWLISEGVRSLLSDEPFRPIESAFVDSGLRMSQADAVFWTRRKDGGIAYALLEHKSFVDQRTPLQLAEYMIGIWRNHERREGPGGKLPLIIPIVIFHGRQPWNVPLSLRDMVDSPADPFEYILLDLYRRPFEDLPPGPRARSGLGLMKYVFDRDPPLDRLVEIVRDLNELKREGMDYMVGHYQLAGEVLERLVREADPQLLETLMPTVAEAWKEEGKREGLTQGKAEGKAEALLRLLERRFGAVPEVSRARVLAAPVEDLDAWLDAVISASSLDDIFRNGALH